MRKTWLLFLLLAPMLSTLMGISSCNEPDPTPPPGECRDSSDCTDGQMCIAPGESAGCGICYEPENQCQTSKDCGTGFVCGLDESPCLCSGPTTVCMPACTADSCPEGQACTSDGTCQYISCATGGFQCPEYTSCNTGAPKNGCERWVCSADKDCSGGTCVEGQCYGDFGYCSYPVPLAKQKR